MPNLLLLSNIAAEIALIFAVALLVAYRRSPRTRALLFRCAFSIVLLAPLTLLSPAPKLAFATVPVHKVADAPQSVAQSLSASPAIEAALSPASRRLPIIPPIVPIGLVWLAGAVVVVVRHFVSLRHLSRAFEAGAPPAEFIDVEMRTLQRQLAIAAPVALRVTDRIAAPCAFGWRRPMILIPTDMDEEAIAAVLAHELCHVRNRDPFWVAAANFACALNWFNPLAWLCAREHRADIEFICDDEAARTSVGVAAYAKSIVEVARSLVRPPAIAAAMMSGKGLAARMRSLITREEPMTALTFSAKASAIAFSVAALGMIGGVQIVAASEIAGANPGPGEGVIYLKVASKAYVTIEEIGAMCGDNADCHFEAPLGATLVLRGRLERSGELVWSGCEVADDGSCTVTIGEKPARVAAKVR